MCLLYEFSNLIGRKCSLTSQVFVFVITGFFPVRVDCCLAAGQRIEANIRSIFERKLIYV